MSTEREFGVLGDASQVGPLTQNTVTLSCPTVSYLPADVRYWMMVSEYRGNRPGRLTL